MTSKRSINIIISLILVLATVACVAFTGAWFSARKDMGGVIVVGGMNVDVIGNKISTDDGNQVLTLSGFAISNQLWTPGLAITQTLKIKNNNKADGKSATLKVKMTVTINGVQNDTVIAPSGVDSTWVKDSSSWYSFNTNLAAQATVAFCTGYTIQDGIVSCKAGDIIKVYFVVEATQVG